MKSVVLCSDDYALNAEVSEGIRLLVSAGRLSAVSCMVASPCWRSEAEKLGSLQMNVDVGLHFNLTHRFKKTLPSLRRLIRESLLGNVDPVWLERELRQQLDDFEQAWGKRPDFVDGHQHAHVFPGIRKVFIRVLADRYATDDRPWVRRTNPSVNEGDAMKKAVFLRMLSAGFASAAGRAGLELSGKLAGLYSLSPNAGYHDLMRSWLRGASAGSLVMCHPGLKSDDDSDGIRHTRRNEWQYLNSRRFAELCEKENVAIARFHDCLSG